jgi:hypothetical protein
MKLAPPQLFSEKKAEVRGKPDYSRQFRPAFLYHPAKHSRNIRTPFLRHPATIIV